MATGRCAMPWSGRRTFQNRDGGICWPTIPLDACYVVEAVKMARQHGLLTGGITNNLNTSLAKAAEYAIETVVGPEFVTGSTRMKSGTAQKMILNMISTTLMIRLGRVRGNRMVNMQLTNAKLIDRGTRMLQESLGLGYDEAQQRLLEAGSVEKALKRRS